MVASTSSDLYSPFQPQNMPNEDNPPSSEDGSGVHSPVLFSTPYTGDSNSCMSIHPNPFSFFIHPSIKSAISMIPPRISTCHTTRLPIRPPINRARSSTVFSNHQAPIDTPHLRLTTTLPESICMHPASLGPLSTFDIRHQHHIHDNHPSRRIITTLRHSSFPQWNALYLHQPVPWPAHPNPAQWPPPPHLTPPAPSLEKRSQQRSSLVANGTSSSSSFDILVQPNPIYSAAAVKSDATQRVPCATTVSADQTTASTTRCQNVEAPINAPAPVSAHVRNGLQTGLYPHHQRGKE